MEYVKKLTEKVVQEILSQGVRDMPQNPGAQGYTERQIRQYFYVPEEKILRLIQEVETAIAQAVEDLEGSGTLVIDKALSNMSTNPVQNMVIAKELEDFAQEIEAMRIEYRTYTDQKFNGANKALAYIGYSTMISALKSPSIYGVDGLRVGQNIYIMTLSVPDLWISWVFEGAFENFFDYQYTSDEDFVNELKTNGIVKVGKYGLSALETQKVDLTEYEKTADVDEKLEGKVNIRTTTGNRVYGHTAAVQKEFNVVQTPNPYGLPMFNPVTDENLGDKIPDTHQGTISVANPRYKKQVVNKEYVDTGMWLPAYDETATYSAGQLVISTEVVDTSNSNLLVQRGGIIYKSLIDNNTGNALTDTTAWEDLLSGKVDKIGNTGNDRVYAVLSNGTQTSFVIQRNKNPGQYHVASYMPNTWGAGETEPNNNAWLLQQTPIQPYQAANKKYVDEAVANAGKLYFHRVEIRGVDETVPKTIAINLNIISSKSESFGLETDYSKLFITKASGGNYSPDELISIRLGEFYTYDEAWGKTFGLDSMIDEKSIYITPLNNENLVISVNDTVTEI